MKHFLSVIIIAMAASSTHAQTSPETITEIEARIAQIEHDTAEMAEELRSNRLAYQQALREACYAEIEIDRFRALTTPACATIFRLDGLDH